MFLFLSMLFLHVVLSMQHAWYGILTDCILVTIISIFTPIANLRRLLSIFFHLAILNGNAVSHIAICLGLSMALLGLEISILKRRTL